MRSRYDSEWHKLVPISGQPSLRLPFNRYAEPELIEERGTSKL
jgi:hypothetical protein